MVISEKFTGQDNYCFCVLAYMQWDSHVCIVWGWNKNNVEKAILGMHLYMCIYLYVYNYNISTFEAFFFPFLFAWNKARKKKEKPFRVDSHFLYMCKHKHATQARTCVWPCYADIWSLKPEAWTRPWAWYNFCGFVSVFTSKSCKPPVFRSDFLRYFEVIFFDISKWFASVLLDFWTSTECEFIAADPEAGIPNP